MLFFFFLKPFTFRLCFYPFSNFLLGNSIILHTQGSAVILKKNSLLVNFPIKMGSAMGQCNARDSGDELFGLEIEFYETLALTLNSRMNG